MIGESGNSSFHLVPSGCGATADEAFGPRFGVFYGWFARTGYAAISDLYTMGDWGARPEVNIAMEWAADDGDAPPGAVGSNS